MAHSLRGYGTSWLGGQDARWLHDPGTLYFMSWQNKKQKGKAGPFYFSPLTSFSLSLEQRSDATHLCGRASFLCQSSLEMLHRQIQERVYPQVILNLVTLAVEIHHHKVLWVPTSPCPVWAIIVIQTSLWYWSQIDPITMWWGKDLKSQPIIEGGQGGNSRQDCESKAIDEDYSLQLTFLYSPDPV